MRFKTGFRFREGMGGSYRLLSQPGVERPFGFRAMARVENLPRFLHDLTATLAGTVEMEGFADGVPLDGTLEINLPGRVLRYQFTFRGNDGRSYRLAGHKDLQLLRFKASLSRLPAKVYDEIGKEVAVVDATFDVDRDLVPLLRTLRPILGRAA